MARKRHNWLSFDEARFLVRDESIAHQAEYFRWHVYNRPRQIPKRPDRVYKEFKGWNDWLGNNNKFKGGKRVAQRPFVEAVAYAHSLNLAKSSDWPAFIREHGIPNDVPSHPELYYKQWVSWGHWLGNTVTGRIAGQQTVIASQVGILYIVAMPGMPSNIMKIGVEAGGVSALRDAQAKQGFRVIKMYKMEEGYDWEATVARYATRWWEDDQHWVVSNIHELAFDLFSDLVPA